MKHWLWLLLALPVFSFARCGGDGGFVVLQWLDTDFNQCSFHFDSLVETGAGRDGVPSIERPRFELTRDVPLPAREPIVAVTVGDQTRGYPLRMLIWHQIINDTFGEVDLAITFDPLSSAALVYERRVGEQTLDFGTTGFVRGSSLVMYDRQTESWWQQYVGTAIAGEFNGQELALWLSQTMSYGDFVARFPEGEVMVPFNETFRDYGSNPYVGYDSSAIPFLYPGQLPQTIAPMEYVLVAEGRGVSASLLRKSSPLEFEGLQWHWKPGVASALDDLEIANGRDLGSFWVERDGVLVNHHLTFAFMFHAFKDERLILVD